MVDHHEKMNILKQKKPFSSIPSNVFAGDPSFGHASFQYLKMH